MSIKDRTMLDFYLLGIARSGTSVLSRTFNLHSEIFCGNERFTMFMDPKDVVFPDSFLDSSIPGKPLGFDNACKTIPKLKTPPTIIGDKLPRKIYTPSHLHDIKKVCIYREHAEVAASWDVRASNPADPWSKSCTGFISFFDLMLFFMTCSQGECPCFIDYKNLFWGTYKDELEIALNYLGANVTIFPFHEFEKQYYNKKTTKKKVYTDQRLDSFSKLIMLPEFEQEFMAATPENRIPTVKTYGRFIQENVQVFFESAVDLLHPYEFDELMHIYDFSNKSMTPQERELFLPFYFFASHKSAGPIEDEVGLLTALHTIYPEAASILIALSKSLCRLGDTEQAIQKAKEAIAARDDNPHFYSHLGTLLARFGDFEEAKEAQTMAIALNPSIPGPHIQLSQICNRLGDLEQAIQKAKDAIAAKDGNPHFYSHLGNLLKKKGDLEGAKEAQEMAISLDPSIPDPYIQLSHIYNRLGDMKQAIQKAKDAIAAKDDIAHFYTHLGNLLKKVGDFEGAKDAQEKAIALENAIPDPQIAMHE